MCHLPFWAFHTVLLEHYHIAFVMQLHPGELLWTAYCSNFNSLFPEYQAMSSSLRIIILIILNKNMYNANIHIISFLGDIISAVITMHRQGIIFLQSLQMEEVPNIILLQDDICRSFSYFLLPLPPVWCTKDSYFSPSDAFWSVKYYSFFHHSGVTHHF